MNAIFITRSDRDNRSIKMMMLHTDHRYSHGAFTNLLVQITIFCTTL